jgi:tRNA pseudouridine55 synthase
VSGLDGLLVVDKPQGLTSHDVVARVRRLAGTRKVGHAGTLDPMATGVLVVGLGRATRLLGHLAATDKAYTATIRLGQSTLTDDAEGEVVTTADAAATVEADVLAAIGDLTGDLEQVPSSVSAVKVDGERAYRRVRGGETVDLKPRRVTVSRFDVLQTRRPTPALLDVDVVVECTTGTYVRALARDLGAALGTGGHLTALRRTRVGRFDLGLARALDVLADTFSVPGLDASVAVAFPRRDLSAEEALAVSHGRPVPSHGEEGPTGAFDPAGHVVALMTPDGERLRVLVGLVG